ncbi:YqaI family protein [Metabacillus fastidiosus]|uniref:YqaI family protein n=1 Tax=Metabacillus fastidiosus TaxID=1458 RepID=UPI003D272F44
MKYWISSILSFYKSYDKDIVFVIMTRKQAFLPLKGFAICFLVVMMQTSIRKKVRCMPDQVDRYGTKLEPEKTFVDWKYFEKVHTDNLEKYLFDVHELEIEFVK